MRQVRTQDAVGLMLCHDITRIVRGESKGPAFRKGHIVEEGDIEPLLSIGKEHLYVWDVTPDMLHEDDAAAILYELCRSEHLHATAPSEGKIEAIADVDGLLKVDVERLGRVNSLGDMMIATRHTNRPVRAGDTLAGMRVIPLIIERQRMEAARRCAAGAPILRVLPYLPHKVGIVTTGSEVYAGRIEDSFTPVVMKKVEEFGGVVVAHETAPDDPEAEVACMRRVRAAGADLVLVTGGMSVDPDDRTPLAIRTVADRVVTYGAPVLPGAMMMLAYGGAHDEATYVGLPGCVMYAKRTIFDLILPRIMAGEVLTREDMERLGHGGLCLDCPVCTYPNCGFGV
ncbi:MAG: molybdopterin-binding protein [Olsenella profusa]